MTFLGSGGPTRSHDDILPLDLVEFLQKIEKLSGEDGYQHLAQKFKLSRLVAQTNGGLGSMARIYLAHLLPPTPITLRNYTVIYQRIYLLIIAMV